MLTSEKPLLVSNSKNKSHSLVLGAIDKALETAFFYGFTPIKNLSITREDGILSKESTASNICLENIGESLERCHRLETKISLLRNYIEGRFQSFSFPLLLSVRDNQKSSTNESFLNLFIVGAQGSIAEALALKTSLAILSEREKNNPLEVQVNSVGDRESFLRFEKDLASYLKKHTGNHTKNLEEFIKKEMHEIPKKEEEVKDDFWLNMPKPMNYLTPVNIRHFKEVLEYLESFDVNYCINHFLIPSREYCQQTIFQIKEGDETVALGVRHQNIARKLKVRKDIPLLVVGIRDDLAHSKKISLKKIKPKFFLIQFGNKAKAKSLIIIEILRKSHIPLQHLLIKDKLLGQLVMAENLHYAYILIVGEKEALENSVLIRNVETRVQETVLLPDLSHYLRKIRI